MFTGIVQAIGIVDRIEKKEDLLHYGVIFPHALLFELKRGASVSIDGVCQTVVSIDDQLIYFDAIGETLQKTTLKNLRVGNNVNLERAAKIGDEIGGHLLSGHIYGTASIDSIKENIFTFQCPNHWTKYLFSKGFIAIDGISLTLGQVDHKNGLFSVHLIPETLLQTTLGNKKKGDLVNLELDPAIQAAVETVERLLKL